MPAPLRTARMVGVSLVEPTGVVPAELIDRVERQLAGLPTHVRRTFLLRLERWWPDLLDGVGAAYPMDPLGVASETVVQAARAYAERSDDLHERDERRTLDPGWFQSPEMVGYAAYAERFTDGGLHGVGEHIDHLQALGVTYLHLMPLLQPGPEPNDGGYAVADYHSVRADLGTMDDLRALTKTLHAAGISLCLDLVLNHVARSHEWAQRAASGDERYRDYFWIFPDRTEPDAYEATLPEVFPDFAPGSFTWDDDADGWVWTTFNDYQWDLRWANPDVFAEMLDVVLFLANAGVDVLRLDAIAFIWKRLGTNCQNQPEVHAITQALRAAVRMAAPATIFLAEAIVAPSDLVGYLGQGAHHGKVSDLAYHNSLMVQIWSMLATRDVRLAMHALSAIPSIPANTTWLTYVRCHDDIGWAIDDQDAAAVGLSGFAHRAFLSDFYSGSFPGSFADGLVFQHNPDTGDRRISGAAASLAGLGQAVAQGDTQLAEHAVARALLAYALISFWGGIPVIWYGDEVATPNDLGWADEPGHADDNRWTHRPILDWSRVRAASEGTGLDRSALGALTPPWPVGELHAETAASLVWHGLRRILACRKRLGYLHGSGQRSVLSAPDPGVLVVRHDHPLGVAVGLFNMTEQPREVPAWFLYEMGLDPRTTVDALTGQAPAHDDSGAVLLAPYGALWLGPPD